MSRVEQRVDEGSEDAGHAIAEHVPAVDDADHACVRDHALGPPACAWGWCSPSSWRVLASQLVGVDAFDPVTITGVLLVFATLGFANTVRLALGAAATPPQHVLRDE